MRVILVTLVSLLSALDAQAAIRRLSSDCAVPAGFKPTEAMPLDLDLCVLAEGDDITELLKDIGNNYGAVYVRAPSKSISLVAQTTQWVSAIPGKPIKTFVFLEDQDPANKLTIKHSVPDVYAQFTIPFEGTTYKGATLWTFQDHVYVKIGGTNLSLTLVGTHPGLGTGNYITTPYASPTPQFKENVGFIEARMVDGSSPDLFDVRANIRFTHRFSIYTYNGRPEEPGPTDTAYRIKNVNVAGVHYATSGVLLLLGVQHAWSDPDRFWLVDPYGRVHGWDGTVSTSVEGGIQVGCNSASRAQVRNAAFEGYKFATQTGGVTIQYGAPVSGWRFAGRIGTSINDPYIIRLKDYGITGPGTGYPEGVRISSGTESNFIKGDPNDAESGNGPIRFIRLQRLPPTPANGQRFGGDGLGFYGVNGCTEKTGGAGPGNFVRMENDFAGRNSSDFVFEFSGDWKPHSAGGNLWRGANTLFWFANPNDLERMSHNTLRLASDTTMYDQIKMHDTNTVTGPGTFTNLQVSDLNASNPGRDNTISDTNISGVVTVDANTERTTIRNVNFTGAARAIITIGSGSSVVASNLCVPNGSTITGAGSLTYKGVVRVLPFAVSPTNECTIIADDMKPQPPTQVEVL